MKLTNKAKGFEATKDQLLLVVITCTSRIFIAINRKMITINHQVGTFNLDGGSSGPTTTISELIGDAVYVRKATKSYGVGRRRSTVLDSFDMIVKKGTM